MRSCHKYRALVAFGGAAVDRSARYILQKDKSKKGGGGTVYTAQRITAMGVPQPGKLKVVRLPAAKVEGNIRAGAIRPAWGARCGIPTSSPSWPSTCARARWWLSSSAAKASFSTVRELSVGYKSGSSRRTGSRSA